MFQAVPVPAEEGGAERREESVQRGAPHSGRAQTLL
jgi:hypothetical protein